MIDTVSLNYRIENKKKTNLRLADSLKKETKVKFFTIKNYL